MNYRLENWSVGCDNQDPFIAPEMRSYQIQGEVYGHPDREDGSPIVTSSIVEVKDGGVIETYSGSTYQLGNPRPEYVKWCEEQGCHVPTQEEPIKTD